MQLQKNKTKKILKKIPTKTCYAISSALFVAGSIGMTYHFTNASASDYSLTSNNVTLDGEHDGSAVVMLKTSQARSYVAIQTSWSLHEVVNSGASQTSYLTLSGMKRGGSTSIAYGANGFSAWTPEDGNGMQIAAGGEVISATYTVSKDTPAGTYKVKLAEGLFTYDTNGTDEEEEPIALDATVTVTRDSGNGGGDNTGGDNTGGDNTGGDNTGGDNTGGDNTGGDNTGGDNTGGDNTGGDNTGGDNTGGDNAGGDNTGGDNTGGDNTGGDNTGGDNTGGNAGGNTNTGNGANNNTNGDGNANNNNVNLHFENEAEVAEEVPNAKIGALAAPNTGQATQENGDANLVTVSMASLITASVLFITTVRLANRKKIDFKKI